MARRLTADRLAARLAKMGGARLSAEEYGDGDDLLGDDDSPAPIHDASGKVDMEKLLCDLLRALGVELPEGTDEKAFKQELYAAAMRAISERTGKGKRPGGTSSAGANGNPLIPGGGVARCSPTYLAFSLSHIERLADPTAKRIALESGNLECDRLNHDRREAARSAQRQQEAQLSEARSRRAGHREQNPRCQPDGGARGRRTAKPGQQRHGIQCGIFVDDGVDGAGTEGQGPA